MPQIVKIQSKQFPEVPVEQDSTKYLSQVTMLSAGMGSFFHLILNPLDYGFKKLTHMLLSLYST